MPVKIIKYFKRYKQRRGVALVLLICSGLQSCSSSGPVRFFKSLQGPRPQAVLPAYTGPRYKVVILEFSNSANVSNFEVVADANLLETDAEQEITNLEQTSHKADTKTDNNTEKEDTESYNEHQHKIAGLAREVTETELFKTGRFEVLPYFVFQAAEQKLRAGGMMPAQARMQAARNLGVKYFIYGDLTDFEIRTETSYWKVPFWAIILVGSFFIKDDDTRIFIWYSFIRAATIVPLDNAMWKAGVGSQDLDLVVSISMDLRISATRSATVIYSGSRTVERHEKSSSMELVVWRGDNKVRINQSNAGRQIRFVAGELARESVRHVLPQTALDSGPVNP